MKNIIFLMLTSLLTCSLSAKNEYELFLQGNKAYTQHEYSKALEAYEGIENKGPTTWFNMGNCYYKKGDCAQAHVCWLRAQRGASWAQLRAIEQNRRLIASDVSDSFMQSIQRAIRCFVMSSSWLALQFLFLMLLYLLLFVYKYRYFPRVYTYLIIVGLLISAALLVGKYILMRKTYAVVVATSAPLYAGPNERYHTVATAQAGDCLAIQKQIDLWYKVSHGKKTGWVLADALIVI